jgi:hypothetical protein
MDGEMFTKQQEIHFRDTKFFPYINDLFNDLAIRSEKIPYSKDKTIDRNTFCNYVNLPGILGERLFNLASNNSRDERIYLSHFLGLMLSIFSHNLEDRVRIIFRLFDFK